MKCKSFFIFTFLLLLTVSTAKAKSFTVSCGNEPNLTVKVVQLIMTGVYEELGYQVEFECRPLKRAIQEANSGAADAEVARIKGLEEKFPNLIRIPVPIYTIEGVAFTRNENLRIQGWESLAPYRIGILHGVQFAEKRTEQFSREYVRSMESLFKMLYLGRIDVALETKINGMAAINRLNMSDDIHIMMPPLATADLYHYVNKKNEHLAAEMTQILNRMKRDGSLDRLIQESERQVLAGEKRE